MTNGYQSPRREAVQYQEPVLRYTTFQRSIGHAFVGALFGAILGNMFLPYVFLFNDVQQYLVRFEVDLADWHLGSWGYAALGAVLGVLFEVPRGLAGDARRLRRLAELRAAAPDAGVRLDAAAPGHDEKLRSLADEARRLRRVAELQAMVPGADASLEADSVPGLEEKLRRVYSSGSFVAIHNAVQADAQGISFAVADVTSKTGSDNAATAQETVAYYEPDGLLLPTFTLQPEGRLTGLVARVAGIPDIDFPSHPAFSSAYLLSALIEEDARLLFNDRVLAELGGQPGFHVESVGDGLALFLPGQLLSGEELKGFIAMAARIFRLFEEAARAAGFTKSRVPPKRDAKALVGKMPGLGGIGSRRTLVTRADAETFASLPPPRRIPKNIAFYPERFAPRLFVVMGALFALTGAGFAFGFGAQAISSGKGLWNSDWFGVPFGLFFVAFGAPMVFYFGRRRYRIARVLRHGRMVTARIEKVGAPDESVNDVQIALMTVVYRHEGREVRASCKIAGHGPERAKKLAAARKPAAILQDPAVPQRILFVDDLISVGTELEP